MSPRAGSYWFVMFCAVFMSLCRDFLPTVELQPYQSVIHCVRTLSVKRDPKSCHDRCTFPPASSEITHTVLPGYLWAFFFIFFSL